MQFERAGKVPVYILAGGRSARFESDKARAIVKGAPMIAGVAAALETVAERITVVGRMEAEYEDLGLRTIGDRRPGLGPMGGLLTAMEDIGGEGWLLLAACDWVGLRAGWGAELTGAAREELECVYFDDGRPQPLFALYRASAIETVRRLIGDKRLAMQALIERLKGEGLRPPVGWAEARNANRKTDIDDTDEECGPTQ